MPPATSSPAWPSSTYWAAVAMALSPDRQTLLTVRAGTVIGTPPRNAACRAVIWPCPAWSTWPMITCSTAPGSAPARSRAALMASPPSSTADSEARAPPKRPIGVRAPAQITGWVRSNMVVPPSPYAGPSLPPGVGRPGAAPEALPDRHRSRMAVAAQPVVLGDQPAAVLHGGRVDQSIGGVAGKRRRQRHRGRGDRGRHPEGLEAVGQLLQPGTNRNGHDDPLVGGQPRQLEPGDGRDRELIGSSQCLGGGPAESIWLGRPPLHDVRIEQDRGHGSSQVAPVLNSSSSSAALIATPVNLPFRALGPLAGTRRATVRPCLVISISSPAATASSTDRILAFTSVAVI